MPTPPLGCRAHVIAVAPVAVLGRMGRRHRAATSHAMQQSLQHSTTVAARRPSAGTAVLLQEDLHLVPKSRIDDGRVLALVDLMLVSDLAYVQEIGEQVVQARLGEGPA